MGRGDELYQYGSWHADKKICDLKHLFRFLSLQQSKILALYVMQRYTITIKGTSIGLVWTDMLYAAPMTTSFPEHILLCIALIIMISTLIYILRGRKYECL